MQKGQPTLSEDGVYLVVKGEAERHAVEELRCAARGDNVGRASPRPVHLVELVGKRHVMLCRIPAGRVQHGLVEERRLLILED